MITDSSLVTFHVVKTPDDFGGVLLLPDEVPRMAAEIRARRAKQRMVDLGLPELCCSVWDTDLDVESFEVVETGVRERGRWA